MTYEEQDSALEMTVYEYRIGPAREAFHHVTLTTDRGIVEGHYYRVPGSKRAAIWVGGAGGGWDSPAHDLYSQSSQNLTADSIASLRIRYRHPNVLAECILDVLSGLIFLEHEGIRAVAVIGHSFGGAVVIGAAAASPLIRTVITLSTQSRGIAPATELVDCSILLIHGKADRVLSPRCSEHAYELAPGPKQLILYDGAGHSLDEVRSEVLKTVEKWIVSELSDSPPDSAD
jgi:pimeloyl-ACP methyl ester carboxylesterase